MNHCQKIVFVCRWSERNRFINQPHAVHSYILFFFHENETHACIESEHFSQLLKTFVCYIGRSVARFIHFRQRNDTMKSSKEIISFAVQSISFFGVLIVEAERSTTTLSQMNRFICLSSHGPVCVCAVVLLELFLAPQFFFCDRRNALREYEKCDSNKLHK